VAAAAFSAAFSRVLLGLPGKIKKKKGREPFSLPDYERNPFLRPMGGPLSPSEMARRSLPGERHGQGLNEESQ
jgi:hypothetical protein